MALGFDRTLYVGQMVSEYRAYWARAATELGATFTDLTDDMWEVGLGSTRTWINNSFLQFDDPVRLAAAADKPFCYRIAEREAVSVPHYEVFTLDSLSEARRFIERSSGPFVVKPARGTSAAGGVTTGVSRRSLTSAAVLASTYDRSAIVERMVFGETYRLLFLDGELLHTVRRRGLRVVGDGTSTIERLAATVGMEKVESDALVTGTLEAQDLLLSSVPQAGQEVLLRSVTPAIRRREPRTVYDEVVTHLPSEMVAAVSRIVAALDLEFVGVDVVSADPSGWPHESGGVFLEANGTPALHHHLVPASPEEGLKLSTRILRRLLVHPGTS